MKKLVKIVLIAAGAVVVLVIAAALLVPRLVDPNQYKDRISTLVKEKTGRDLTITGDISLSVFPWLGAEIGAVQLGNAPGFGTDAFAAVRQVKVKVKLLPLLSKQVEADVVTVEGLVLNLKRDPEGRTNWEDLAAASAGPSEKTSEPAPSEKPSGMALAVGGLDIRDASISWTDQQSGTAATVKNLAVSTSAVNLLDPVEMNVRFDLDTGGLGLSGTVHTAARIELDLDAGRYAARNLTLKADLKGEAVPGGSAAVTLNGGAAFDAGARTFSLDDIRLEAAGLNLAAYTADALVKARGTGDLAAGTIRLGSLEATATLTGGEERITATVTATADADLNTQQFTVSDLTIRVPELSMKGLQAAIETKNTGSAAADLAAGTVLLNAPALSGTLSGETVGGAMPVALDLQVRGDLNKKTFTATPVTLSVADMTTRVSIDLAQLESGLQASGILAVAPFNLRDLLSRLGVALPDTADPQALSTAEIDMKFHAGAQTAAIDSLSIRLDDTTLSGALSVNNFEAPETILDLSLDRLQLERYLPSGDGAETSRLLTDVSLKGKIASDAGFQVFRVASLSLAGKLDKKLDFGLIAADTLADLAEEKLTVNELTLTADKLALKAGAEVTGFSSTPAFTASVQSEAFNLRQVLSDLDLLPETADAKAMSAVKLSASLSGSPNAISVSSLKLRLDDTDITGKADVTLSPAPAYAFDIAVDSIDADRYLPPPAPEKAEKEKTAQAAASASAPTELPVELLRSLSLDGKLAVGKLKINKLTLSDIQLQAVAKEGLLTLNPLSAGLYEGALGGTIRLDARGQTPNLSLAANLAGVQSGKLLKDLQGKAVVTGLANSDLNLSATGANTDTLLASLGGTVSFTFTDGTIKGVDIAGKLCNTLMAVDAGSLKAEDIVGNVLQSLVQKATGTQAASAQEEADSTSFSEMGGSMTFAKGVGTSEDLSMKSPMLRVQGAGSLDLPKQQLDYDATAYLVKSCQGQGGKSTEDLRNVPIPVNISGPLAQLKVKPNLTAGILEILARKQSKKTEPASPSTTPTEQNAAADQTEEKPQTVEDAVTGILQDLLKKR